MGKIMLKFNGKDNVENVKMLPLTLHFEMFYNIQFTYRVLDELTACLFSFKTDFYTNYLHAVLRMNFVLTTQCFHEQTSRF